MSSDRLYYTDPYLVEFDAVVRDVERRGDRWSVTLDRSAFYPTSGGQPHDIGTIEEAVVSEVLEQEDGCVAHLVDREIEPNARVRGQIDWHRRFDHMQQHTGQHLLSAAFEKEAGAKTVSFHLGVSASTIDLDRELAPGEIVSVEDAANRVLWEDREVSISFVTEAEAAKLPLRKDPTRSGELRIIEIQDYDVSACGGTHVSRTGAIGVVATTGSERFKGGMRIEFVCGVRALRAFRALKQTVDGSIRLLSVAPVELPTAIEKLQAGARAQQKLIETLQERLAEHEAEGLAAAGERVGSISLVARAIGGWDAFGLKKLAAAITSRPSTVAVLLGANAPHLIVVARSAELTLDAGRVLAALVERFGGKGGGKGPMAQGGGLTGEAAEILSAARDVVKEER